MALPEPPPNVPRIVDVQNPATGHHVVMVRMPTNLANKFPDKPWGTSIADIGLSKKDSDQYAGYTLVDIEPLKGSPDLYWIFQKLDGPVWTTKSKGQDSLVPAKYRRLVTTTRSKQEVDPATNPSDIVSPLIQSIVQQEDNTGKAVKVNVEETIDVNGDPLVGQLTDTWGVNTTTGGLVIEGSAVDSGFGVKSSRVVPLGDGKSIKETENYPADGDNDGVIYTLNEEKTDDKTGIVIDLKKSLIDASQQKALANSMRDAGWYPEVQPVDKWHSIMVSAKVDLSTLPGSETWKEGGSFNLPNVLEEVGVVWDSDIQDDAGASGSNDESYIEANDISWSVGAEVTIAGSVTGRPYTKVKAGRRGTGEVTVVRTYHVGPPTDSVTTHEFREVYGMLLIHGVNGVHMARATQQGRGANRTTNSLNYRRHLDNKLTVHDFGPLVHSGALAITHLGDPRVVSLAKAATTGTLPGSGFYPVAQASLNLEGKVELVLPSSGPIIGSGGSYVLSVDVSRWGFNIWVREVRTITVP